MLSRHPTEFKVTKYIVLAHLWLVASNLTIDGCEHAANFATGNAQIDAHVRLQAHATTLQRGIHCQMDGIVAFSCIILMDDRTVIGHFVTGGPPTWNVEEIAIALHICCIKSNVIAYKQSLGQTNMPQ